MNAQFRNISLLVCILNGESTPFVSLTDAFLVFKIFFLKADSCYVVQASLRLTILLHQPLLYWNHGCAPRLPALFLFLILCKVRYIVIHYL